MKGMERVWGWNGGSGRMREFGGMWVLGRGIDWKNVKVSGCGWVMVWVGWMEGEMVFLWERGGVGMGVLKVGEGFWE